MALKEGVFDLEEWRDVVGFEDRYEVSDHGNIRSKSYIKFGRNAHGIFQYLTKPRVIRQNLLNSGYLQVKLYDGNGQGRCHLVHRLVALAHLPPPPVAAIEVNHKDHKRNNNLCGNLEWMSSKGNYEYSRDLRLAAQPRGEAHPQGRLTEVIVRQIRSRVGETLAVMAKDYGVSYQTIASVLNFKTWKHVK